MAIPSKDLIHIMPEEVFGSAPCSEAFMTRIIGDLKELNIHS
jgi:hypothetical protein